MKETTRAMILAAVVLSSLAFVGCATIMNGTSEKVEIASLPSGATVLIDGKETGITPVTIELKRKDDHRIKITLEGYEQAEYEMKSRASGWVWGNLPFLPWLGIGFVIDLFIGEYHVFQYDQLFVELKK